MTLEFLTSFLNFFKRKCHLTFLRTYLQFMVSKNVAVLTKQMQHVSVQHTVGEKLKNSELKFV